MFKADKNKQQKQNRMYRDNKLLVDSYPEWWPLTPAKP